MISVIIPAHNEETTIRRCLNSLLSGNQKEFDIVVACNGCHDQTADVARSFGDRVTVIETPVASKVNALNLADRVAVGFPRVYLDADVTLSPDDIHAIANVLKDERTLAAAPQMKMDFLNSSWSVRAYYRVWQRLPYVKEGMMGAGVYALSERGRQRFGDFPEIIADDGYVRALFGPRERTAVADAVSIVTAPATLSDLIRIKTRSRLGGYQLGLRFPELLQNDQKKYGSALFGLLRTLSLWPCIPVYLYVNLVARRRARAQLTALDRYVWERDESSRRCYGNPLPSQ